MVRDFRATLALWFILKTAHNGNHVLRIRQKALLLASALLLVGVQVWSQGEQSTGTQNASAASRLKPSVSTSKQTQYVSCWDKTQKFTGSHLVRTPIFVSSDGSHRAYVEVEATAFQPRDPATYSGPLCENTSRLFVAGPGETKFGLAYSQSQDFSDGNSLKLVDWSPDRMHLLIERTQWTYESEGDYTDFLLFDANSGAITQPDLLAIIAARYGKDCGSENSARGFTPEGKVVVAVAPLTDEIALMNGAKSCVKRETLLIVDLKRGLSASAEPLAGNFKVVHYGKFQESPAAK
jgi:hypothetical protein